MVRDIFTDFYKVNIRITVIMLLSVIVSNLGLFDYPHIKNQIQIWVSNMIHVRNVCFIYF